MSILVKHILELLNSNLPENLKLNNNDIKRTISNIPGDYTIFLTRFISDDKSNTEKIVKLITDILFKNNVIDSFEVIHVFTNIKITNKYLINVFKNIDINNIEIENNTDKNILIEYSSPNTNKPLHLGHLRNIFIGYSLYKILKKCKYNVHSVTLINDRGIHICKSMVAYKMFGDNKEPSDLGIKGDHFVGDFYVKFDKVYKEECKNYNSTEKIIDTPIMLEAKKMLKLWEDGDQDTILLWKKLNSWVLNGFKETYNILGIKFDKEYFESETYILGKEIVKKGLNDGVFYKKNDGSIWVDLKDVRMDEKLLLRSDETSVYITQDLGTLELRQKEYNFNKMLYVVGDEQIYHFKVLIEIAKKLKLKYSDKIYHIAYGMVELPNGKMKSREGTVVDADDLIQEMFEKAKEKTEELNKLKDIDEKEKQHIYRIIGLNSLRFYILKIDPRKKIIFDPVKSIDFSGDTGTFIMYSYVRIVSLLNKINIGTITDYNIEIDHTAKNLIFTILEFNDVIIKTAKEFNPALLSQYLLKITKEFNKFYETVNLSKFSDKNNLNFHLFLITNIKNIIEQSFEILGMEKLEKM